MADDVVDPVMAALETQDDRDSLEIILDALREYGLESLVPVAHRMLLEGTNIAEIPRLLRAEPEYGDRFPAMDIRDRQGLTPITAGEYIGMERKYRQIVAQAGFPAGFYDLEEDLADFIGNDVSETELTTRVALAAAAVQNVNPELKNQLRDLYGVGVENDGELIAYFLDPERAVTAIESRLQLESAGLSAAAVQATGQGLEKGVARQLANRFIPEGQVGAVLAPKAGLTQATLSDRGATTSELAASEFGLDSDATAQIRKLRQRRQASAMERTGGLMTGMGASGLGTAQNQ